MACGAIVRRSLRRQGGDEMTETETVQALEKLAESIDELRAEMPEDSKRSEQLQDAYYLVRDAIEND